MSKTEQEKKILDSEIFGSFHLNDCEFALSVARVQEVVNSPEKFTPLPLAPSYLIGIFNLRGQIIPVISLEKLLQLENSSAKSEQKVAIVELEGFCVGLLFEKTGEIFKSLNEERSDFSDPDKPSVISGIFKKDQGKRLIQILNVPALFNLQHIPQIHSKQAERKSLNSRRGLRRQCISFVVGPAKCALRIDDIQEIVRVDKITKNTLAGDFCIGTINLRGATVPLIDFPAVLGYREVQSSPGKTLDSQRIVILREEHVLFGLLVDGVDRTVPYYQEDLKAFPNLDPRSGDVFAGCISVENQEDLLLFDYQKLRARPEIREVTKGHFQLTNKGSAFVAENQKAGARQKFITFTIDSSYAVNIKEVKEIINYPKTLLHPPGTPTHCKGVLNLRGDLVTIIDAKMMYFKDKLSDKEHSKIIIFKKDQLHFGLIVDSIDSIVSFYENQKTKLPDFFLRGQTSGVSQDVAEAIQFKSHNGEDRCILVLNSDAVMERVLKTG